jgi:ATP-binding cassette subfamily F protein 3
VGYDGRTVLSRLSLNISNDDRIGLLGSNGNGKSTFAKLVAGRLEAMGGELRRSSRLDVGFFAQHQIDDLDPRGTPYSHVAPLMTDATQAKVRGRCAQIGFPNVKADTRIELLSGGEKARLLMGLATFSGPHLIIMDEPTNHLDIDSRAALIEAINAYDGAIILVSHDRHLLEACADRLWLVGNGGVTEFDGDMDDYRKLILDSNSGKERKPRKDGKGAKEAAPEAVVAPPRPVRSRKELYKKIDAAADRMTKFEGLAKRIDEALAKPGAFAKDPARAGQLAQQRSEVSKAIAAAEDEWLELTAELEGAGAG